MELLCFEIPYENKEKISDSKLLELHKKYWTFIAENKANYKPEITLNNGNSADIINSCFLCEYARRKKSEKGFFWVAIIVRLNYSRLRA